jgi:deoxyribodipyrimidine photolyase-related protein
MCGVQSVWVFGDQCHREVASLRNADPADTVVLFVTSQSALSTRRWHRQRLHLVLAGMAKLADSLRAEGFTVDERTAPTLRAGLDAHRAQYRPTEVAAMAPMSWDGVRLLESANVRIVPNDQFLCSPAEFAGWSATRKSRLRMEDFYRWQRTRLDVLLEPDGEPAGGRWNYDDQNRLPPPRRPVAWPEPERFEPDAIDEHVRARIDAEAPLAFGTHWDGLWPTTTAQAMARLDRFCNQVLPGFGPYEDAMLHDNWHLSHSLLSSAMNLGMVHPRTVLDAAVAAYRRGIVPLASAEGFIRQVIGWREYVWGIYWTLMPQYRTHNVLDARASLPPSLTGASTAMRCVTRTIADIDEHGYAHHIQRLMILGNLGLLLGVEPSDMVEWMWTSFVDGAEWVMLPNLIGMSLHADGGLMATKPYAAGGAYVSKMSDYCRGCAFDPKVRTGPKACPFTTLYWDFLDRHEERFRTNHRMGPVMAGLRQRTDLDEIRLRAREVRDRLATGGL